MTTHHIIKLVKTNTDLKVTYRDGKFRKLEHLRGVLDQTMLDALGKIVPREESELTAFKTTFASKVVYTSEAMKPVSVYSQFFNEWTSFFMKENKGRKPKFTGADGTSLKQIIAYLIDENDKDEAAALSVWTFILENWKHLPDFFKNNQDLKIINSKLNVIIRELQNKHTSNERTFQAAAQSESARAFKFGKNG